MKLEIPASTQSGYSMVVILLILQIGLGIGVALMPPLIKVALILTSVLVFICWFGLYLVNPNEGVVLQLFGKYIGTCKNTGLRWANPLYSKKKVSLRVRNFESSQLKVNDLAGNPVEIAAVIVWKVVDTAEAMFEVDDYEEFVAIQSEAAIRNMATSYAYDDHGTSDISLRSDGEAIAKILRNEVQNRLEKAGVDVMETRISHLAYAPEIASAMLQRQQASAIVAARQQIVDGAVGMVELALDKLQENNVVELDEERKAAMVSNLLVVLCGDKAAQPVVNTGTLYN